MKKIFILAIFVAILTFKSTEAKTFIFENTDEQSLFKAIVIAISTDVLNKDMPSVNLKWAIVGLYSESKVIEYDDYLSPSKHVKYRIIVDKNKMNVIYAQTGPGDIFLNQNEIGLDVANSVAKILGCRFY